LESKRPLPYLNLSSGCFLSTCI